MSIVEAVILGILQGLTEFLPVSSSAHLALAQYFLGLEETPVFFDVMLHVGTLLAVLIYYGPSLWTGAFRPKEHTNNTKTSHAAPSLSIRLVAYLILATIPAGLAGITFRPTNLSSGQSLESVSRSIPQQIGDLREYASQRPWTVLTFLTVTGGVLLAGSRCQGGDKSFPTTRWWHVLSIGCAQAVSAICPGMSRSGMTVSTGMYLGLRPEWAVHFSLLMSLPAIAGAAVLKARDLDPQWLTGQNIAATAAGTLVSALIGWCCIHLLLGAVRRGRWWWFTVYIWLFVAVIAAILSFTTQA